MQVCRMDSGTILACRPGAKVDRIYNPAAQHSDAHCSRQVFPTMFHAHLNQSMTVMPHSGGYDVTGNIRQQSAEQTRSCVTMHAVCAVIVG